MSVYQCLDHADPLISQRGDTADWVNISECMALLRQDVQCYERPSSAYASASNTI